MNTDTEFHRALEQHDRDAAALQQAEDEARAELDLCADRHERHNEVPARRAALDSAVRAAKAHAAERPALAGAVANEEQRQRAAEEADRRRAAEEQRQADERRAADELAAALESPLAALADADERLTVAEQAIAAARAKVKSATAPAADNLVDLFGRAFVPGNSDAAHSSLVVALGLGAVAATRLQRAAETVEQIDPRNQAAARARHRAKAGEFHGLAADLVSPCALITAGIEQIVAGLTGIGKVAEARNDRAVPLVAAALVHLEATGKGGTLSAAPLGILLASWLGVGATEAGAYEIIAQSMGVTAPAGAPRERAGRAVLAGRGHEAHALAHDSAA